MRHIQIYENYTGLLQSGIIPIAQVLSNKNSIVFSVLPDQNTVVLSQSNGKGGIIPGSSYKYSTQGKGSLGISIDLLIKSIEKNPTGGINVRVIPSSSALKKASASKIGPDGWINTMVKQDKVDDLINDLIETKGVKGTLETKSLDVKFTLIGPA